MKCGYISAIVRGRKDKCVRDLSASLAPFEDPADVCGAFAACVRHQDVAGSSTMEINRIELLSVGIDVGSATSHLVFSKLLLVRDEMSPTLRFNIEERKVLHEGRIIHTPFLEDKTIDIEALTAFFKEEYEARGD